MQPLPVPTSTISGPLDSAQQLERRLDQQLGLRARDQHVGCHAELVLPERLDAREVLERHALRPLGQRGRGRPARPRRPTAAPGRRDQASRGPSRGRGAAGARRPTRAPGRPGRGERRAAASDERSSGRRGRVRPRSGLELLGLVVGDEAPPRSRPRSPSSTSCRRCSVRPMRWSVTRACGKL